MTVAELLETFAEWSADIESEPFPTFEHLTPAPRFCGCGLPMVSMVYQWRPDGGSVTEPKCRDHKDEVPS